MRRAIASSGLVVLSFVHVADPQRVFWRHLFIANPFGAVIKHGLSKLFSTHPPVEERIKILRGM